METLKLGGDSVLASDSNALPLQKPDILAALLQAEKSLRSWKQLMAEGKVESLVVKLDSASDSANPVRMLSPQELEQLRATKIALGNYVERILTTIPNK